MLLPVSDVFIPRINGYAIDSFVTESHETESEITSFPVETGADVTDHARLKKRKLVLEAIVSDSPIGDVDTERQINGEDGDVHSQRAWDMLDELDTKKTLCVVETASRLYQNMVLESLVVPRDKDTGRALKFTATFSELRIRDVRRLVVLVAKDKHIGKPKKLGTKAAPTLDQDRERIEAENRALAGTVVSRRTGLDGVEYKDVVDEDGHLIEVDANGHSSRLPGAIDPKTTVNEAPWWSHVGGGGINVFDVGSLGL